jgi:c-di-GMP-binding flagellar brake protein YcgR
MTAAQSETRFSQEERTFLVHSPGEIAHLLRSAAKRVAMFTVYFDRSADFAMTSILEVDSERGELVFELPAQPHLARRIVDGAQIMLVTYQDGIKIKFALHGATPVLFDGTPALRAALPLELLRLQRRETFRVACPLSNPVRCSVPYVSEGRRETADLVVVDLSLGGVSLTVQHPTLSLEPGDLFADCRIALPAVGTFATGLEVRNAYQITLKNGTSAMRSGCRFVDVSHSALALVQKYIMKLERERNARFGTR